MTRSIRGAVAVTGADGHVGRRLMARLADHPNPLLPLTRDDDWAAALPRAEAVVHLSGTLQPRRPDGYGGANLASTRRMLQALAGLTRRVVFLSFVGADPGSSNPYLRTKGEAEEEIRRSGIPSVVFRSTYVYGDLDDPGPSFTSYRAGPSGRVLVVGDGSQRIEPIHVGDICEFLVRAALDEETPTGTFDVGGPRTFTLDEFVGLLNPAGSRISHIPGRVARLVPGLTSALVDVLSGDCLAPDSAANAVRFGVVLQEPAAMLLSNRR